MKVMDFRLTEILHIEFRAGGIAKSKEWHKNTILYVDVKATAEHPRRAIHPVIDTDRIQTLWPKSVCSVNTLGQMPRTR
ncbi:MAG TPA: hypothetical protein PLO50_05480 [Nitrospira sp.]|nr:hypothetical protein [Nitrospira sp.]